MIFFTFVIQTVKARYFSMRDLHYAYMTGILSKFLVKRIRATECCTKHLCYAYTTAMLSMILITTTILLQAL